jgi:aminoglycoside phosphotransferase (APT) family kinase protein
MNLWQAEHLVDERLVRELVGQFPELAVGSLEPLSEGWDRSVWLVDDAFVFGFPRRAIVVPGVEREIAFLPRLASLLPLAIPVPVYLGRATADYPWPFFGSALVPGEESGRAALDDARRTELGVEFARFLRRLHSADVAAELGVDALPLDSNQRADMTQRVPKTRTALRELRGVGLWREPPQLAGLLDRAERLQPAVVPPAVVHGDLHFRHLLVDRGHASGVIDWIDLCRGDPAIDLQILWSFVPPDGRSAFLDAYGPVSDDQLVRARVVALSLSASLALYGRAEALATIEHEALAALDRTLSE